MGWACLPASLRAWSLSPTFGRPAFRAGVPSLRAGEKAAGRWDNEPMWEVTVERTAADEEVLLVRRWRRAQFMRMGFGLRDAQHLTGEAVDVADMRRLVSAGCPLETARRILL